MARIRSEAAPTAAPAPSPAAPTPRMDGGALAAVAPPEDAQPDWLREEPPPYEPPPAREVRRRVERVPGQCSRCGGELTPHHILECPRSNLVVVPVVVRPLAEMPPMFAAMSPAERAALGMRVETSDSQMEIR